MLYGLIDLGSNSIRMNLYRCDSRDFYPLVNKKVTAGLAGYVEHGMLSPEGIAVAQRVVSEFVQTLRHLSVTDISVFATASLRNICNTDAAVRAIEEAGVTVDVISGDEEARCAFLGASRRGSVTDGVLIDIGGGSTELVACENGGPAATCSLPFGSLSLFGRFVGRLLPDAGERREIRRFLERQLAGQPAFCDGRVQTLYGVGGSVRAAVRLRDASLGKPSKRPDILSADELDTLLQQTEKADRKTLRRLLKIVPERIHTLVPGLLILQTVLNVTGARQIVMSRAGVREGYLITKVLPKLQAEDNRG